MSKLGEASVPQPQARGSYPSGETSVPRVSPWRLTAAANPRPLPVAPAAAGFSCWLDAVQVAKWSFASDPSKQLDDAMAERRLEPLS